MPMEIGPGHPRWRGGRRRCNGYVTIWVPPGTPGRTKLGYVMEHRLVMAKKLGRDLLPREVVHHINGIKDDNRPENLEIMPTNGHHLHAHCADKSLRRAPGEPNPLVPCACGCGRMKPTYNPYGNRTRFINGHNKKAFRAGCEKRNLSPA